MKLIASLAIASALSSSVKSVQVWTSHPNYEACVSPMAGMFGVMPSMCFRKYYTVTEELVQGEEAAVTCGHLHAYPWCPESEEESKEVYANLAMLEYKTEQGRLDVGKWVMDGISKWTGVELNPNFNGMSKEISNYVCPNHLKSSDGVMNFPWDTSALQPTIFKQGIERNEEARCVAMGEGLTFKWGNLPCVDQEQGGNKPPMKIRKRAVCVTTVNKSNDQHHSVMDMEAPEKIKQEFKKIIDSLATAAMFLFLFFFMIFTGCCFCCCFCCCCKPCRSGDKEPEVQQTVVTTAAAPAPAPAAPYAAPPPAPAPVMPAYGAPPAPAPYNPYGAPAYGQQQPPMGGINLNISNNNTNTNR